MHQKTHIQIHGLRTHTATAHLEKKIEAIPGVQAVELDPQSEEAIVEHDDADLNKIVAAIADEGLIGRAP